MQAWTGGCPARSAPSGTSRASGLRILPLFLCGPRGRVCSLSAVVVNALAEVRPREHKGSCYYYYYFAPDGVHSVSCVGVHPCWACGRSQFTCFLRRPLYGDHTTAYSCLHSALPHTLALKSSSARAWLRCRRGRADTALPCRRLCAGTALLRSHVPSNAAPFATLQKARCCLTVLFTAAP